MIEASTILTIATIVIIFLLLFTGYRAWVIYQHKKRIRGKIPQNEQILYWQNTDEQLIDSNSVIKNISSEVLEDSEQAFIINEDFLVIAEDYINKKYKGAFALVVGGHFPDDNNLLGYQELDQTELEKEEQDSDIGFSSPAATLASCGLREYKLLMNNHTDLSSSLKNLTIDFFSSSGVTMAATQLGSKLGRFAGPVGMMVGGLIGGAIGALGSKLKINKFKYTELNSAIAEYQEQAEVSQNRTRAEMHEQIEIMNKTTELINASFNEEVNKIREKYFVMMRENKEQWNKLITELIHKFGQHNQEVIIELQSNETEILNSLGKKNSLCAIFMPTEDDVYRSEVINWFNKRYTICNKYIEQSVNNQQQVFTFYSKYHTANVSVVKILEELVIIDPINTEQGILEQVDQLAEKFEQQIHDAVTKSIQDIEDVISEQATLVYEKKQKVKAEARKLGKDI